jgi:hypothetical protein
MKTGSEHPHDLLVLATSDRVVKRLVVGWLGK